MKVHEVKTWPEYFDAQVEGDKGFEYRLNDRDYEVGDILYSCEFEPKTQIFSGLFIPYEITYVMYSGFNLPEGMVIMSVRKRMDLTGQRPACLE